MCLSPNEGVSGPPSKTPARRVQTSSAPLSPRFVMLLKLPEETVRCGLSTFERRRDPRGGVSERSDSLDAGESCCRTVVAVIGRLMVFARAGGGTGTSKSRRVMQLRARLRDLAGDNFVIYSCLALVTYYNSTRSYLPRLSSISRSFESSLLHLTPQSVTTSFLLGHSLKTFVTPPPTHHRRISSRSTCQASTSQTTTGMSLCTQRVYHYQRLQALVQPSLDVSIMMALWYVAVTCQVVIALVLIAFLDRSRYKSNIWRHSGGQGTFSPSSAVKRSPSDTDTSPTRTAKNSTTYPPKSGAQAPEQPQTPNSPPP